jgi:hypothetical protein
VEHALAVPPVGKLGQITRRHCARGGGIMRRFVGLGLAQERIFHERARQAEGEGAVEGLGGIGGPSESAGIEAAERERGEGGALRIAFGRDNLL